MAKEIHEIREWNAEREKLAEKAMEEVLRKFRAGEIKLHELRKEAEAIIRKFAPTAAAASAEENKENKQNIFETLKAIKELGGLTDEEYAACIRYYLEKLSPDKDEKIQ